MWWAQAEQGKEGRWRAGGPGVGVGSALRGCGGSRSICVLLCWQRPHAVHARLCVGVCTHVHGCARVYVWGVHTRDMVCAHTCTQAPCSPL